MARSRWRQLGAFPRNHIRRRQETILRTSVRHRRRGKHSCRGGALMHSLIAVFLMMALLQAPAKKPVPRTSNGKPDLTGVWQGGSTVRGNWEDANGGTGVGGSGRNPSAPVALSSNDRPAGREGAPYQPWAAKKVLEAFN